MTEARRIALDCQVTARVEIPRVKIEDPDFYAKVTANKLVEPMWEKLKKIARFKVTEDLEYDHVVIQTEPVYLFTQDELKAFVDALREEQKSWKK